jgi:serine/threonine protein kinase
MQYLPSTSLQTVVDDKGVLAPTEVARIGADVASALASAHQAGIVHRDVKPANVLIAEDGTVKITDFGISHALGDTTLTSTGMVTGTPAYLAPEVARGTESGFASDVFSLGATLYTALEGTPPFGTDQNPMAMLHKVASGQVLPPHRSGPLTPLLMRMLGPDPADRPPMIDVAHTLAALYADSTAPLATAATQQLTPASAINQPVRDPTAALPVVGATAGPAAMAAGAAAASATTRAPNPPTDPPVRSLPPGGGLPDDPERRRPVAALAALAVVLVAGAAVLVALLLNRGGTPDPSSPTGGQTSPGPTASSTPSAARTSPASSTAPSSPSSSTVPSSTQPQSSSASATQPSSTAASSSSASSTAPATGGSSAAQLSQAISSYYALLPGNTDQAWSRLTARYQASPAGGRQSYQNFWDAIDRVSASNVSGSAPRSAEATITYHYKNGRVVTEQTSYGLVREDGIMKIDSSTVLGSRG